MTYSEIAKERDELKSENETLRAIMDRIVEKGNELKPTNKELRHRAEVAERALADLQETFTFDYQAVMERAEKELEEVCGE